MSILTNPVFVSVVVMAILCLLKVNVMLAIMISALLAGVITPDMGIQKAMSLLIDGMSGNSTTALSYILLGALAVALKDSGLAGMLGGFIERVFGKTGKVLILALAGIACFSQNLVPVHIAFIPILIPPLLSVMNRLKIDRRAVACALTFGLKAPYLALPVGFGLIFHGIVAKSMAENGMPVETMQVWKSVVIPALSMVFGLFLGVFVLFNKPREYKQTDTTIDDASTTRPKNARTMTGAALGALAAFVIQLLTGSLPLGALVGLGIMIAFGTIPLVHLDTTINGGIYSLGFIAFVMLVAAGYGNVLRSTGGVDALVASMSTVMGGSKLVSSFLILLVGLVITMGIGTSFGTIPILATIYVPLCAKLGFSVSATVCLIAVAGALGDAGSPASDSTLGPTAGLNADGQHDHIRDTCIPTFLVYNIPLIISGVIAASFVL